MRTPVHLGILENCEGNVLADADGHDGYRTGLPVNLPNRKFPSRILNGLRVGNPQANFSRSPKPSQEIVFPYSNICFTQFMWVSPWASMVASSFNLAKRIAIPISAGTSPWAARSGMLRFVAADSATVIHLLPQKSHSADQYMQRVRLQKKSKGIVIKPIGLLPVSKIILWIWPGVTIL